MQTEGHVITRPIPAPVLDERHPAAVRQEPRPEMEIPDLLGRVIFVGLGFGIALTGFMVILSILLVFIDLPLFFFGLAMMEVGLKVGGDVGVGALKNRPQPYAGPWWSGRRSE